MDYKQLIRSKALALGFSYVGFAKAEELTSEAKRLEQWLLQGYHGQMTYMENHFDKRIDPRKLVPGSKTVISFLFNYYNPVVQQDPSAPKISMYAYGRDYHKVVKKKLKELFRFLQAEIGDINGRCFVDSAPVMEREWALRSGLGWLGKNTLLIQKKAGSYFFLAELICDLEVAYDSPAQDHCGSCTRCIDACPTAAIAENGYIVDGSKCISYLTIELKENIPVGFKNQMENWMFGCDICQQVCPWNRFSTPHAEPDFNPKPELIQKNHADWQEITAEVFDRLFIGTAVKRTKFEGLHRNIMFLKTEQ